MLRVSDLMSSPVLTVTPTTPLEAVAKLMEEAQIHHVPVVDNGRLVGIISSNDLTLQANDRRRAHTAADIMTIDPVTIDPEAHALRVAELLTAYRFGALPIVAEGRLVGIITSTDVLDYFSQTVGAHKSRHRRPKTAPRRSVDSKPGS